MDVIDFDAWRKQRQTSPNDEGNPYFTIDEFLEFSDLSWAEYCVVRDMRIGPPWETYAGEDFIFVSHAEEWKRQQDAMSDDMMSVWITNLFAKSQVLEERWLRHFGKSINVNPQSESE